MGFAIGLIVGAVAGIIVGIMCRHIKINPDEEVR